MRLHARTGPGRLRQAQFTDVWLHDVRLVSTDFTRIIIVENV
jgi:hypothetical protein